MDPIKLPPGAPNIPGPGEVKQMPDPASANADIQKSKFGEAQKKVEDQKQPIKLPADAPNKPSGPGEVMQNTSLTPSEKQKGQKAS